MTMVMTLIIRDDVVASQVDCVSARDLEEDALIFADGNVEGLLEVLL
jgi:hypothetical protein